MEKNVDTVETKIILFLSTQFIHIGEKLFRKWKMIKSLISKEV